VSNVRIIKVKSRLATIALGKGGIMAQDAVAHAERAIDAKRGDLLAALDALLTELEARFGAGSPEHSIGDCDSLYALASQVIDLSACLRGSYLDKAANALCNLADLSAELETWDRQAVELHVMSMRLLRNSGDEMPAAKRERVVIGLHNVTAKRIGTVVAGAIVRAG
jgi:hypothetical protein